MASQGTLEQLALDVLSPFHRNARLGDIDAIAASLTTNGQYRPIVVNLGTMTGRDHEVLAGNHTLAAAQKLGWDLIDCYIIDVDDATATRINLADNKIGHLGGFDDSVLYDLLRERVDFTGTGYSEQDLTDLTALLGPMPDDNTHAPAASEPVADSAPETGPVTPADDSGPRSIALGGLPPLYRAWLHGKIAELQEEFNVDSPADVLIALIIAHTGSRPE